MPTVWLLGSRVMNEVAPQGQDSHKVHHLTRGLRDRHESAGDPNCETVQPTVRVVSRLSAPGAAAYGTAASGTTTYASNAAKACEGVQIL